MPDAIVRREMDYVSRVRDRNRELWLAFHDIIGGNGPLRGAIRQLIKEQGQWNALDYGNTLGPEAFDEGEHENLTKEQIGSVVFDTANALETLIDGFSDDLVALLATGHATNMANLL